MTFTQTVVLTLVALSFYTFGVLTQMLVSPWIVCPLGFLLGSISYTVTRKYIAQ